MFRKDKGEDPRELVRLLDEVDSDEHSSEEDTISLFETIPNEVLQKGILSQLEGKDLLATLRANRRLSIFTKDTLARRAYQASEDITSIISDGPLIINNIEHARDILKNIFIYSKYTLPSTDANHKPREVALLLKAIYSSLFYLHRQIESITFELSIKIDIPVEARNPYLGAMSDIHIWQEANEGNIGEIITRLTRLLHRNHPTDQIEELDEELSQLKYSLNRAISSWTILPRPLTENQRLFKNARQIQLALVNVVEIAKKELDYQTPGCFNCCTIS